MSIPRRIYLSGWKGLIVMPMSLLRSVNRGTAASGFMMTMWVRYTTESVPFFQSPAYKDMRTTGLWLSSL